ncbi:MAG: HSP40/DnaJ peptide-binding protein [Caldilineales bacterium]|nr:HSP40/DnaJ peptide-binding protein [Caldilineales bacterium]
MAAFAGQGTARRADADSFSEFFEFLFGGRPAAARPTPSRSRPWTAPRSAEVTVYITLEEALRGGVRTVRGSDGLEIQVQIPPGVATGTRLRLRGLGPRDFFGARGDLYLTVHVQPHPQFERRGDDLYTKLAVDAQEVQRRGEVRVPTLEQPVVLKVPPGTRSGQVFRLRGLGLPRLHMPDQRGDLYVALELRQPAAQAAKAPPSPRRRPRRRLADLVVTLRRVVGIALAAAGFLAVAALTSLGRTNEWLMMAALATALLALAAAWRSAWAAAAGVVLAGVALWLGLRADLAWNDLLRLLWPLLPLALGLLLASPASRRPR